MRVASRLAALVVAVGLVVGALALRDRDASPDGDDGPAVADGTEVVVRCPADVASLCASLDAVDEVVPLREEVTTTVELAGGGVLDGAWVVPTAWADVVDDERVRAGGVEPLVRSEVVASTPVVFVGYTERISALAAACGTTTATLPMTCVADIAGSRWGDVNGEVAWGRVGIGHASPETTLGLMTTATVAAGLAGADFGATELRDPTTAAAFRAVEDAVRDFDPGFGGHVGALRTSGPSVADLVVAVEAEVVDIEEPRFGPLTVTAAVPPFAVELVVVGDDDGVVQRVADALARDADAVLADAGWRVDGAPAGTPLGTVPDVAERPDGSSLIALRLAWDDLVG